MEFGDCLVGVKNEDCEGNATMVICGFSLRNFNFFTSSDYCVILVHAENGISFYKALGRHLVL